jgi:hypothetical protein
VAEGKGCRNCNKPPGPPKASLSRRQKEAAACNPPLEWLGDPTINANLYTAIRCTNCGTQFSARPNDVKQAHRRCPNCWQPSRDQRDDEAAELDPPARWVGNPTVGGSAANCEIECLGCRVSWKTKPNNVQQGFACPNCSKNGFKPSKPAFVYLVLKPDGVAKVGISNTANTSIGDRLKRHRASGYVLQRTWAFQIGADAQWVEKSMKHLLKTKYLLLPAAPEGEDGYTESFHSSSLPLADAAKWITQFSAATETWDQTWLGASSPAKWKPRTARNEEQAPNSDVGIVS